MPRIYFSPSTQEHNVGVIPGYIEETEMNAIADITIPLLQYNGFEVFRNSPAMNHISATADSNKIGVDYHFALHSNAGGGEGTVMLVSGQNAEATRISRIIYDEVAALSPSEDRGVRIRPDLTELKSTNAPAGLLEVAFHDDKEDAEWIRASHQEIAEAIVKGFCKAFGITFRMPGPDREKAPEGFLYRVQVGAYSYKDNAQIMVEKLKAAGYNSYIKLEKK